MKQAQAVGEAGRGKLKELKRADELRIAVYILLVHYTVVNVML